MVIAACFFFGWRVDLVVGFEVTEVLRDCPPVERSSCRGQRDRWFPDVHRAVCCALNFALA